VCVCLCGTQANLLLIEHTKGEAQLCPLACDRDPWVPGPPGWAPAARQGEAPSASELPETETAHNFP